MMVLSGMGSMEMMEDNISFMKDFKPLTEQEHEAVRKVRDGILFPVPPAGTVRSGVLKGSPFPIFLPASMPGSSSTTGTPTIITTTSTPREAAELPIASSAACVSRFVPNI